METPSFLALPVNLKPDRTGEPGQFRWQDSKWGIRSDFLNEAGCYEMLEDQGQLLSVLFLQYKLARKALPYLDNVLPKNPSNVSGNLIEIN